MNFIAAMLLMNLHDEESSFWCFVYIMFPKRGLFSIKGKHKWRNVFAEELPKIAELDKKLRMKIAKKAP